MSSVPAPTAATAPRARLARRRRSVGGSRANRPAIGAPVPPRLLAYIGAAVALALVFVALAAVPPAIPGFWIIATDAFGAAFALATGAIGLAYFRSFGARSLLFVSIGFLGAGLLHGLHLLLQLDLGSIAVAAKTDRIAATSAAAGQAYLAALLLMGWRAREGQIARVAADALGASSILGWSVLAAAVLVAVAFALPQGPGWAAAETTLRLSAAVIGLAFSLTLGAFLHRGDWRWHTFQHGFIFFLLCVIASQFAVAVGPAEPGAAYRLGADGVRNTGYAIALLALLASTSRLLQQVSDQRLSERIEALIESQSWPAFNRGESIAGAPIRHRLQGAGTFELDLESGRFRGSAVTARLFDSPTGIDNLRQFDSLLDATDREALKAALERSKREGVLFKQQYRIRTTGGQRWIEAIAGVEFVAGRPARLLGFVDDITARKSLELDRQRLQDDLRQVMAAVDQLAATATLSADGTIQSVNERFCALCGESAESVIGRRLGTLLQPAPGSAALPDEPDDPDDPRRLDSAVPWYGEVRRLLPDGSSRIAQASLTPHHVHGGDQSAFVFVGFDITDRVEAEHALRESIAAHRKSNEDLQMFAHIVSHDLQEPLRMVSSFMTLLERRYAAELPSEAREFIHFAVEGAQRMRKLLEGLLEYSRVNSQGGAFQRIGLRGPVEDAVSNLAVLIGETAAEIDIGPLPDVRADPSQMAQLVQNLLANAIKFCPHKTPHVRIEGRREGNIVIVTVSDNGIGIDPVHFDRIFQIFQRLHARGEFAGTGVGLAVCKRIMERHGGRIELESKLGDGTTFRLEFPAV